MDRIDLQYNYLKQLESLYINDDPRIEVWLDLYFPFLKLFIQEIHLLKEQK